MEVVAGSYEEIILGYKLVPADKGYVFEASFSDHSHTGALKTVALSRRGILASGGSDETIRLFNVRKKFELGSLQHHEGSVTCLCFHGRNHLFSSSEDGTIGVWKVGKWECVRTFRGHKGAVYSIAVHPSGKMALSVGKDRTMRTWNLITGKYAYVTNIKQVADLLQWSPDGSRYMVVINNNIDIYSIQSAAVEGTITLPSRVYAIAFVQPQVMAVSGDGGIVTLYDIVSKTKLQEFSTHTNRVKGLTCCSCPTCEEARWLVSASSDGMIKLWQLTPTQDSSSPWSIELVAEVDTKFRLTCLASYVKGSEKIEDSDEIKIKEETAAEEEEEEDSEESVEEDDDITEEKIVSAIEEEEEDDDEEKEAEEEENKEEEEKIKPKTVENKRKRKRNRKRKPEEQTKPCSQPAEKKNKVQNIKKKSKKPKKKSKGLISMTI